MFRPLRIEFAGSLYHAMAWGDARAAIFLDGVDRETFGAGRWRVAERFQWRVWAFRLMGNHNHLLLEAREPILGDGCAS